MTSLVSAVFESTAERGIDVTVKRRCPGTEQLPVWIVTVHTLANVIFVRQFTSAGAALALAADVLAGVAHEDASV